MRDLTGEAVVRTVNAAVTRDGYVYLNYTVDTHEKLERVRVVRARRHKGVLAFRMLHNGKWLVPKLWYDIEVQ